VIFILILFVPYYLLSRPAIHPTIGRLAPVVIWGFIRCLQTLIVYLIFLIGIANPRSEKQRDEFILAIKPLKVAVIFGLISAFLVIINIT